MSPHGAGTVGISKIPVNEREYIVAQVMPDAFLSSWPIWCGTAWTMFIKPTFGGVQGLWLRDLTLGLIP